MKAVDRPRSATVVLGGVLGDEGSPDQRAARITERLGRKQLAVGLDEREPRPLVAPVERNPREDLPAQVARPDAVAREAETVVDASAAAEDRQMGGRDVDRAAPGVRDLAPA